jgi:hypothetical protein
LGTSEDFRGEGNSICSGNCDVLEVEFGDMGGGDEEIVVGGDDRTTEGPEEEKPSGCVTLEEAFDEAVVIA